MATVKCSCTRTGLDSYVTGYNRSITPRLAVKVTYLTSTDQQGEYLGTFGTASEYDGEYRNQYLQNLADVRYLVKILSERLKLDTACA